MKAQVNKNYSFDLETTEWSLVEVKNGVFHILYQNDSYVADVVSADYQNKSFKIVINQSVYDVVLKDRFDQLLEELGMDSGATKAENDIKAPMPGRVIGLGVEAGSMVKQGDTLLVLEAMKMENIIKSPREGLIESIEVDAGQTVNKNQVLIRFQ
mgnify:FL=1